MPPHGQGLSLAGVITWARSRFKDDFVKIPKPTQFNREKVHPSGWEKPSEAIIVGTAFEEVRPYFRATIDVLAWLDRDRVEVGYMFQVGDKTNDVVYQDLIDSRIDFHEPFSWILQTGDETAVRRFEAFVQYAVLTKKGPFKAVRPGAVSDFKEHFPGACRDIAEIANQRLAEWSRITAPLGLDESEPLEIDTNLTEVTSTTIASTAPPTRDNVLLISPIRDTDPQNEAAEAAHHSQVLSEYIDAVTTLTRKMNTITRLHAREKKQLQAKIENLEKSVIFASKDATKAKNEIERVQEKAKAGQDKIKKAQKEMRRAQAKAVKAEAETHRKREEAEREAETNPEGMRLRTEIQRLERMLVVASSETAHAKDEAHEARAQRAATNKICANQQNEIVAWDNKHEAMAARFEGMRQIAVAWEAEYKTLRASMDPVLGASIQVGGQMRSKMGHQDVAQAETRFR